MLYKPNTVSPHLVTVDADCVVLEAQISGTKCIAAQFYVYDEDYDNWDMWKPIGDVKIPLGGKYNGDYVRIAVVPEGKTYTGNYDVDKVFYGDYFQNGNSYKWRVDLWETETGEDYTQAGEILYISDSTSSTDEKTARSYELIKSGDGGYNAVNNNSDEKTAVYLKFGALKNEMRVQNSFSRRVTYPCYNANYTALVNSQIAKGNYIKFKSSDGTNETYYRIEDILTWKTQAQEDTKSIDIDDILGFSGNNIHDVFLKLIPAADAMPVSSVVKSGKQAARYYDKHSIAVYANVSAATPPVYVTYGSASVKGNEATIQYSSLIKNGMYINFPEDITVSSENGTTSTEENKQKAAYKTITVDAANIQDATMEITHGLGFSKEGTTTYKIYSDFVSSDEFYFTCEEEPELIIEISGTKSAGEATESADSENISSVLTDTPLCYISAALKGVTDNVSITQNQLKVYDSDGAAVYDSGKIFKSAIGYEVNRLIGGETYIAQVWAEDSLGRTYEAKKTFSLGEWMYIGEGYTTNTTYLYGEGAVLIEPTYADNSTVTTQGLAGEVATGSCGEYLNWLLFDDGSLTISGTGAMADYSSSSPAPWYGYRDKIKEIVISDGVTYIGVNSFYNCSGLVSLSIGSGVTTIGAGAFLYCTGLASVTIPDSVTEIGFVAFQGCTGLTSVSIPDSVTTIGEGAFNGCTSLSEVRYAGTEEQWNAIEIGASNDALTNAFRSIKTADGSCGADGANLSWALSSDGSLTISGTGAMADYSSSSPAPWYENRMAIKTIIIEEGATSIGAAAFYGCGNLQEATIPCSITKIGNSAFYSCKSLAFVYYTGTNAEWNQIIIGADNDALNPMIISYFPEGVTREHIYDIYRRRGDEKKLTFVGSVNYGGAVLDYCVGNREKVSYYIFYTRNSYYKEDVSSDIVAQLTPVTVCPDWDSYYVIGLTEMPEEEDDKRYRVDTVWNLSLNAQEGQVSHNYGAELYKGLAPYPKVGKDENDYLSGSLTVGLGQLWCDGYYYDSLEMQRLWRDFCKHSARVIYKDLKGNAYIVAVHSPTRTHENVILHNMDGTPLLPTTVSFNWTEVDGVDDIHIANLARLRKLSEMDEMQLKEVDAINKLFKLDYVVF